MRKHFRLDDVRVLDLDGRTQEEEFMESGDGVVLIQQVVLFIQMVMKENHNLKNLALKSNSKRLSKQTRMQKKKIIRSKTNKFYRQQYRGVRITYQYHQMIDLFDQGESPDLHVGSTLSLIPNSARYNMNSSLKLRCLLN